MPGENVPSFRLFTARVSSSAGPTWRGSSPFAQGFTLLLAAILLVLLIPLVIIGITLAIAGGIAAIAYFTARRALARLRAPNGALDGRKNVRVRMPSRDDSDPTP